MTFQLYNIKNKITFHLRNIKTLEMAEMVA